MVRTENLSFQYKGATQALQFPDIDLQTDEDLLILGKSGIGKTTLLHLLAGLLQPLQGMVQIGSTALNEQSPAKLDAFRGSEIGLVFQQNHAIQSLTVLENLQARLFFAKKAIDKNAIDLLLKDLGLLDHKNSYPRTLSQGQLQRLGIAMSVVHEPKVILADEPTSSLDDENSQIVIELLQEQARKNKANLVVITHDSRITSNFKKSLTL